MAPPYNSLECAEGYLELGMLEQATRELDALPEEERESFGALEIRLEIYVCTEKWNEGEKIACQLVGCQPGDDRLWLAWAECARHAVSNEAARKILYRSIDCGHAESGLVHCKLAYLWEEAGRMKRAKPHYLRGVHLDPALRIAPPGKSRFERP